MQVTKLTEQKGRVMMRRDEVAKYFGISPMTVDNKLKEMSDEIPERYSDKTMTKIGGIKLINILAFSDFLHYRDQLQEKNLRKRVPPYSPREWAYQLGIYEEEKQL